MKKALLAMFLGATLLSACAKTDKVETTTTQTETTKAAETTKAEETTKAAETTKEASMTDAKELTVFAAASMTETLTELGEKYMQAHPEIKIVYNFDSSGTLKTQIEEGAEADVFISAGQKQMNQLDIKADKEVNDKGLDFILDGTRFNILENKVALVVPEGNPKNINSYDDLKKGLEEGTVVLAMGNADVPVGQYTQKILKYFNLDESKIAEAGHITYGTNVKEVTTQVSEGTVDCGVIYQTDAFSAKLKVVDTATKEMCGQVIYPAAVLKNSKNVDDAKAYLEYLKTDEASKVFENVGFTPIK